MCVCARARVVSCCVLTVLMPIIVKSRIKTTDVRGTVQRMWISNVRQLLKWTYYNVYDKFNIYSLIFQFIYWYMVYGMQLSS